MPEVNLEQTTPKSSSSPKLLLIVLGIFALVGAVAYAGYWCGTKQVPPPATTPEVTTPPVTEVPEATPPAEVDETAGWKTYTNTKYGYSIKYPQDAEVKEVGYPNSSMCFSIDYKLTSITIASTDAGGTGCMPSGFPSPFSESKEQVRIGDKEYAAFVIKVDRPGETLNDDAESALVKDVPGFKINYGSTSDKNSTYGDYLKNRQYIYQILSTFKFLD